MVHTREELPQLIADAAQSAGLTVGIAESLTCGQIVDVLGRGHSTSEWLAGGIVAYHTSVKQRVLDVSAGPVVTAECAEEMAAGAAALFEADITVSTTGVGGPGSNEDKPAGTVHIGWFRNGETGSTQYLFAGGPVEVLTQAVDASLNLLNDLARGESVSSD